MKTAPRATATAIRKNEYLPYLGSDKEMEVAVYYGFVPIAAPAVEKIDRDLARQMTDDGGPRVIPPHLAPFIRPEEKIALLRSYEGKNLSEGSQPAMVYYHTDALPSIERRRTGNSTCIGLEILGSGKSIAEATIIQTVLEMLREENFRDLYVDINSLGDKDSSVRFLRELGNYYRKHADELTAHCRDLMRRNPAAVLECEEEKCRALQSDAPKSVAFLSEQARAHFKEVLEYLETLDIPYRINHTLVGNRNLMNHTVFQVKNLETEDSNTPPLALGYRYNSLAKRIGQKRDLPAVGALVCFKKTVRERAVPPHKIKKPKMFFAQIGFEAKLKSLKIIEMLRQARIPLYQSLSKDKMASQLQVAENLRIPYIMIMGQKEAMENTVIIRNMQDRSQDTVRLAALAEYLKKIK